MHEMALAESVLQIVEEAARTQGFARVRGVFLDVGALSGVEPEALAFCFEAVVRGTLAEGARLELTRLPGGGWCLVCARDVPLTARYEACPYCGGYQVQPNAGLEMKVRELEVE